MAEEGVGDRASRRPGRAPRKGRLFALEPLAGETQEAPRLASGIAEFDRVTGGGFVRGSVLLVGGDPGIGKSTLLIQVAAALARAAATARSTSPARRRWRRCGCAPSGSALPAPSRARGRDLGRGHHRHAGEGKTPRLVVIDSIQTMWTDTVESAPGTVTQVRGSRAGADPLRQALRRGRDPGRPRHQGRPDRRPARGRAHGRRGALVRGRRLAPVPHPARGEEPLRPDRRDRRVRDDRRGPARGRQPVRAVPVRARPRLARHRGVRRHRGHAPAAGRNPGAGGARPRSARRAAPWSAGTRAGCRWCWRCSRPIARRHLGGHDVYLNVAGGLRIQEPAADLAAAAALVSSLANAPLPADAVYFGEVSLSGAVRPVAQAAARLKEAQKLGFARAVVAGGRARAKATIRPRCAHSVGAWRAWSPTSPRAERTARGRRKAAPRGDVGTARSQRYTRRQAAGHPAYSGEMPGALMERWPYTGRNRD